MSGRKKKEELLAGYASCVTLRAQLRHSDRIADCMLVLIRIEVGGELKEVVNYFHQGIR